MAFHEELQKHFGQPVLVPRWIFRTEGGVLLFLPLVEQQSHSADLNRIR